MDSNASKDTHLMRTPYGSIRTFTMEGENWVVAADLSKVLGYGSNIFRGKFGKTMPVETPGGIQNLAIMREIDVYDFVANSRKIPQTIKESMYSKISQFSELIKALSEFEIPDDFPEMYVYAIREVESGNIKLGISRNPETRLSQLQTGNSSRLELISYRKAVNKFQDEKEIHLLNADNHLRGEWFGPNTKGVSI